jgi:hypothetical protein
MSAKMSTQMSAVERRKLLAITQIDKQQATFVNMTRDKPMFEDFPKL